MAPPTRSGCRATWRDRARPDRNHARRRRCSDSPEANESALAELVEFVRVGVQLVFDELSRCASTRSAAASAALDCWRCIASAAVDGADGPDSHDAAENSRAAAPS